MKINSIIVGIIGVMICAIIVGGAFLPAVSSVTATSDTYINKGYFDMTVYDTEDNITITWSIDNPRQLIINNEVVNVPEIDNMLDVTNVVMSTQSATRLTHTSTSISFYGNGTYVTGNKTNPSFTLTYVGGVLTATNGTTTKEITGVAEIICIANDGPLTMKKYGQPVYVKDDSHIYANGITYFGSQALQYSIWGEFANITHSAISSGFEVTDFVKNYTTSNNHVGLYLLDDFAFNASYNGETPKEVTYSTFAVTKEVIADRVAPMDRTLANMFSILPIVAIAGLIMAGIYVFINRK